MGSGRDCECRRQGVICWCWPVTHFQANRLLTKKYEHVPLFIPGSFVAEFYHLLKVF